MFDEVLRSGDLRAILDIEQIIGLALGVRCLHIVGRLREQDAKLFRQIVGVVEARSWLRSVDLAAYVAFSVSQIDKLSDEAKRAAIWLNNQLVDLFDDRQHSSYVSALFGLSCVPQQLTYATPLDEGKLRAILGSEQFNVKDLAKLSICLSNLRSQVNAQFVADVNRRVEELISQELSQTVGADLQAAIKEALALAASEIPETSANEILRRVDSKLSQFLEIKKGGTVSLHNVPVLDMPTMDAEKHSLALIAIITSQRQYLYLLDKENIQNAQQGVSMLQSGYRPTSVRFANSIKYLSTVLAFIAGTTLPIIVTGSTFQNVIDAIKLSIAILAETYQPLWALSKLPLPISSIVIGMYFALALFRVMDYGFSRGSITSKALIQVLPIVSRIYKWFKGYRVEDNQ